MAIGFLITAVTIYAGTYVANNMVATILLSVGVAGIAISLSGAHSIMQSIIPKEVVGTATGVMNGLSNAASAFSPLVIGYIITVSGSYTGGLLFLSGAAVLGSVCMIILTLQNY